MKTRRTTYDLIIQSEDKNRTVAETLIYALFILSAIASICQFAAQPVITPERVAVQARQIVAQVG